MGIFKKLSTLFSPPGGNYDSGYWLTVQCNRCGEKFRIRIDMRNDLSIDYAEEGGAAAYLCRKTIIGSQRCYQPIEVELAFDANHHLASREIKGGKFVEETQPEPS